MENIQASPDLKIRHPMGHHYPLEYVWVSYLCHPHKHTHTNVVRVASVSVVLCVVSILEHYVIFLFLS